jgi:hypothetical protein
VHVPAAPQQGRQRRDQAGCDGEVERDVQTMLERGGNQRREERVPGQVGGVAGRQLADRGSEQRADRVIAQERGEHDRYRRQRGQLGRIGGRQALSDQAVAQRRRQRRGQAEDDQREEDADG